MYTHNTHRKRTFTLRDYVLNYYGGPGVLDGYLHNKKKIAHANGFFNFSPNCTRTVCVRVRYLLVRFLTAMHRED